MVQLHRFRLQLRLQLVVTGVVGYQNEQCERADREDHVVRRPEMRSNHRRRVSVACWGRLGRSTRKLYRLT